MILATSYQTASTPSSPQPTTTGACLRQPGRLHEKAGVAPGYEALDSDQSSDQADQDGWATGPPCQKAGVSAGRGAGDQGNADRDTGTDRSASAGTWLDHLGSAGIGDGYGVV